MRKYLLGIMAIMMAISLSAFTSIKRTDPGNAVFLYWFEYDAEEDVTGAYVNYGVRNDFADGPCHVISGPDCRRGYPVTALINQTDPSLGVIGKDLHEDRIAKHVSFWVQ